MNFDERQHGAPVTTNVRPQMRSASVYRFEDRLLVLPNCPTSAGVLLSSEPCMLLSPEATDTEVGSAVEAALVASTRTVAHPTDWKAASAARLAAAGVKSERAFQRLSSLVQVVAEDGLVRISPSHNGGATGRMRGFHQIAGTEFSLPFPVAQELLGAQIRRGLELCTS